MANPAIDAAGIDTSRFVPNPEVVLELGHTGLPIPAQAFLLAASVESMLPAPNFGPLAWPYAWSQFRCLFGFREYSGALDAFPVWSGDTVGGVTTHAAGILQDQPGTYAEIVALTGDPGFGPQSQLKNNWVLAVRDFKARTGGDLIGTLQDGATYLVPHGLAATWPEGCDANFPQRYAQALLMLTPPPPPPPPTAPPFEIPLGMTVTCPASMTVNGTSMPLVAGVLSSSSPGVCALTIAVDGTAVTLSGIGLGEAMIESANTQIPIAVVEPRPTAVSLDLAHGTWGVIAVRKAIIAGVVAGMLMFLPIRDGAVSKQAPPPLAQSTFYLDAAGRAVVR
jgi:hypothetical protein